MTLGCFNLIKLNRTDCNPWDMDQSKYFLSEAVSIWYFIRAMTEVAAVRPHWKPGHGANWEPQQKRWDAGGKLHLTITIQGWRLPTDAKLQCPCSFFKASRCPRKHSASRQGRAIRTTVTTTLTREAVFGARRYLQMEGNGSREMVGKHSGEPTWWHTWGCLDKVTSEWIFTAFQNW